MGFAKAAKVVSNTVYSVGVCIALALAGIALFGSHEAVSPDAMIPWSWRQQAFIYLALGTIPMVSACVAVYLLNGVNNSGHKRRNFILVFAPGFICFACALFIIGVVLWGYINTLLF